MNSKYKDIKTIYQYFLNMEKLVVNYSEYEREFKLNLEFDDIINSNELIKITGGVNSNNNNNKNNKNNKKINFVADLDINQRLQNLESEDNITRNGKVYVASNLSYIKQNKYNIGRTNNQTLRKSNKNNPQTREDKLFFLIVIECDFVDYKSLETEIHDELDSFRNSKDDFYFTIKYSILVKFQ